MDRRQALKLIAGAAAVSALPAPFVIAGIGKDDFFGWVGDRLSTNSYIQARRRPYLSQHNGAIRGTGKGKKAFLHLAYEKLNGAYEPHKQKAPDCTGQAAALGVDFLTAVQIAVKKRPYRWTEKAAVEPIYAGSRVEIGGGIKFPGTKGHRVAEWLTTFGVLHRKKYRYDNFTDYDGERSKEMGDKGVPDYLEPIARRHPVKKTAICTCYEDLCDCIYNGYPVVVCSGVGFGSGKRYRDKEGFLKRKRRGWMHSMLFAGYDDEYSRPGALCFNSWGGKWIAGPTRGPQPPSTFWIDANTVTSMLSRKDSFSYSNYVGFPRVNIPNYMLY